MKQLAIFINVAGPIDHKELGKVVHQIEMGVAENGNNDPQAVRLVIPTSDPGTALDAACKAMKAFIQRHHDQSGHQSQTSPRQA